MFKKISCFLFLYIIFTGYVQATEPQILIINQIRGEDACCDPGNLNLLDKIYGNEKVKNLPMGMALRFDVLTKKNYIDYFKERQELGLLLEVTPSLASESGVVYKGDKNGSDWYLAKNAFLIGYTLEERKKIIDTLFNKFKSDFGHYPVFTVSWMIDAWSLDYISKTYNVKLHELTKEQYETDSYTLYGGIFNAPYYPSLNHPLIPGIGKDKLDIVIVRQTISDLLKNYGSPKAFYTSQPNDYLTSPEHLNSEYFQMLVGSTITQHTEFRFGLLGLENSVSMRDYFPEYINQLKIIDTLLNEKKINITTPQNYADNFRINYDQNQPFYLTKDFSYGKPSGVLWYFGQTYRVRVLLKNNHLILDDLRIFLPIDDPYKSSPATLDFAYWIVPYLFDGSEQYLLSQSQKNLLHKKFLSSGNIYPDSDTSPFGIEIGQGNFQMIGSDKDVEIYFAKEESVKFTPRKIIFDRKINPRFSAPYRENINEFFNKNEATFHFDRQLDFQIKKTSSNKLDLGWGRNSQFVGLFNITKNDKTFELSPNLTDTDISFLSPIFAPDRESLPTDKNHSIFYWNNTKAIAGRNPIRVYILPQNYLGRPTKIGKIEIKLTPEVPASILVPKDYSYKIKPWFIDITSANPLKSNISLVIDGSDFIKNKQIEFIADCHKEIKLCLGSPLEAIQYLSILLNEQISRLIEYFQKLF